jgi:hypothetical protein
MTRLRPHRGLSAPEARSPKNAAKRQGISYGTLRRAKDVLFIESPRRYDGGRPLA